MSVLLNIVVVVVLVALSGLFSGLTLGLMGLRPHELRRKVRLGNTNAEKIYPIRKNGNLLLCTLLLGNVAVNSMLSIFLGSLTAGAIALAISTALIVILGEIVPQAVISRHALQFGARTAWIVRIFIVLLYPATKPLAWALDKTLGRELPTAYKKRELQFLLEEQMHSQQSDLNEEDYEILREGLTFSGRLVSGVMTPWEKTFVITEHTKVTKNLFRNLFTEGYSRVPIVSEDKKRVLGILHVKDMLSATHGSEVHTLMRKPVTRVHENMRLGAVLDRFQESRSHLFVVQDDQKSTVGVITLEDVLEELVGEIYDEHDETPQPS